MPSTGKEDAEIRRAVLAWDEINAKYGDCEYVDFRNDLPQVDPKRIWTEYKGSNQFIVNKLVDVEDFDVEITGYYIFEKPYEEDEGSITLITEIWITCLCKGKNKYCEDCTGSGAYLEFI